MFPPRVVLRMEMLNPRHSVTSLAAVILLLLAFYQLSFLSKASQLISSFWGWSDSDGRQFSILTDWNSGVVMSNLTLCQLWGETKPERNLEKQKVKSAPGSKSLMFSVKVNAGCFKLPDSSCVRLHLSAQDTRNEAGLVCERSVCTLCHNDNGYHSNAASVQLIWEPQQAASTRVCPELNMKTFSAGVCGRSDNWAEFWWRLFRFRL